jgi:hypothetical protein
MSGKMRREKRSRAATKKELIIESGDYCKCFVEVGPHDTLANVRVLIHEDFDDDMLPTCATFSRMMDADDEDAAYNDAARDAFYFLLYFLLAGVRLSRKQEGRKRAWDWVGQTVRILATSHVASGPAARKTPRCRRLEMKMKMKISLPQKSEGYKHLLVFLLQIP